MKEILCLILGFLFILFSIDTAISWCKIYWMWTKREYLEKVYLDGYRKGAEDMAEYVNKLLKEAKEAQE